MADKLTVSQRSRLMSQVRSKHTKPEILARRILHRLGYRFTVNGPKNKTLPGKPDIVLPARQTVVFVHGCFWHRHENCRLASKPSSNTEYWIPKLERNVQRDKENQNALQQLGWRVIVIWECELKDIEAVAARMIALLPRSASYALPEDLEDARLVAESKKRYGRRRKLRPAP